MTTTPDPAIAPRIAVIGGGFSGTVFTIQLLRKAVGPCSITIVEPRVSLGAGVAYGTSDPAHRINVPASRMIVFPEDPTDFDRWFRGGDELSADPAALWPDGHAYPSRGAFGRYTAGLLSAASGSRPDIAVSHRRATAIGIRRHANGYRIDLDKGAEITADLVVLAISHPPPALPGIVRAALGDDGDVIANPWRRDAFAGVDVDDDILIIGTGLTMADVVASLTLRGHRGRIVAFSRRGLLSRGHAGFGQPYPWFAENTPPASARMLVRRLRGLITAAAREGQPWQAVIDDVRAHGRRVWRALPPVERARLLRHLRPFWDVHRYRIAPQVEAVIHQRREAGSLRVLAASLQSLDRRDGKIIATLRPRHAARGTIDTVAVDKIVVTTGPAHGSIISANPALASLAEAGLLTGDPLGLGIAVNDMSEVIAADGSTTATLVVVGPLAREQYGELMGLPQVSAHALEIAEKVAAWLAVRPPAS